ncbi:MAG: hypothetical protein KY475_19935, partial [Planctomycetes bacterium]|nr:hypothetical protein [Planctomycetota bacterium]
GSEGGPCPYVTIFLRLLCPVQTDVIRRKTHPSVVLLGRAESLQHRGKSAAQALRASVGAAGEI